MFSTLLAMPPSNSISGGCVNATAPRLQLSSLNPPCIPKSQLPLRAICPSIAAESQGAGSCQAPHTPAHQPQDPDNNERKELRVAAGLLCVLILPLSLSNRDQAPRVSLVFNLFIFLFVIWGLLILKILIYKSILDQLPLDLLTYIKYVTISLQPLATESDPKVSGEQEKKPFRFAAAFIWNDLQKDLKLDELALLHTCRSYMQHSAH